MKYTGLDRDALTSQDPELDTVDILSRLNINLDDITLVEVEPPKNKCRAGRVVKPGSTEPGALGTALW